MDNYPSLRLINKAIFLFLLVLIMLLNAQHAEAKRTVKAGIYNFMPMLYSDTDGSAKGFFVTILNHIAQKENWEVQYVPGTFQEGQDRLKNAQIDLLLCVGYTEERDKYMDFPKEFLVLDWGTIYKVKSSSISNIFDLEGKKVSILKGSLYPTGFQELAENFHIHVTIKEMNTSNEVLASVVSGSADAGVAPNLSGILNKSWQKLERTPIIFTPLKLGYAVNEGNNGDLISAFDREITAMKADKSSIYYHELEHVMGKEQYVIPKGAYWALFGIVATLLLVIAWNRNLKRQVRLKTEHLETEITERRISEQKLFHEREFSNEALNSLPGVFYIISPENRFLRWNENFETVSEYSSEEFCQISPLDLFEGNGRNLVKERIEDVFVKGASDVEADLITKCGKHIPYHFTGRTIQVEGVTCLIGMGIDITERKKMDAALAESEDNYRNLFNLATDSIFILDVGGNIIDANKTAYERLGYTREELLSLHVCELDHPDFAAHAPRRLQQINDQRTAIFESGNLRKDGSLMSIEVSSRLIEYKGQQVYFSIARDITERKRLEEEHQSLEKQLLHAQKLESLGVLAGGIAHDFNNILTSIIGNAELALLRINKESPGVDNLHKIEEAAARAADLAKQMLAYSGKRKFVIENINLNLLLEDMLHMLEVSISKKSVLRLNLLPDLPSVEADATQIRQIVMNLVINSSEAIGEKSGVIAVTTGCMDCNKDYLKNVWLDENLSQGFYVYLEIADTGCGMDKDTLAKVFDPFFTTKFTGRGLGMAAVLGIVRGHKGAIKVYSEPSKGTSFKILLPASDKPAEIFNHNSYENNWKGSGTVLLVDDEETVRGIGKEMLQEFGFKTITANDGREAVEIFKTTPDISFVILDLTMPHMDGEQCFRELRRVKPDVKVIMSSGFSEHEVTQKFIGKGLAGFIQKPYKLSALKEAIRKI